MVAAVSVLVLGAVGWLVLRSPSGHAHAARPVAVPSNPTSVAPVGPPVFTQVQAAALVKHFWPAHEQALAHGQLRVLAGMTSGAARQWEQAAVGCGCRGVTTPRKMLRANYFVPRQTGYPASFVAAVQTGAKAGYSTEILVFTKSSAHGQWLLTEDSLSVPHYGTYVDLAGPDAAAAGFAPPPTAEQHQAATRVAADLAGLWQQTKDSSDIPASTEFDMTGPTEQRLSDLAAHQQDSVQANGVLGHFTFSASRTDPLIEVGVGGYDLACQPLHETVVYQAAEGSFIFQDGARHNWGPGLAPGRYGAVVSRDLWQTCFLLPPGGSDSIEVFDQDSGGAVVTPYH